MKYQQTEPIGRRANHGTKHDPPNPHRLDQLVEDPLAEKRDMSEEQRAAFKKPGQKDPRVVASEAISPALSSRS